jgi:hypothetical protein
MKRFYVGLVVLAVVPISSCQLIPPGPHSTEKPLWTTDLRDATHTWDSLHAPAFFQATRQIAFGSDAELVVAKASGPFAKPNEVRGIVMDAKNGSVLREEIGFLVHGPSSLQHRLANMQLSHKPGWPSILMDYRMSLRPVPM